MKTIKLKRTITLTTVVSLEVPDNLSEEDVVRALDDECALFNVVDRYSSATRSHKEETEWDGTFEKVNVEFTFDELKDALKEDGLV